MPIAMWFLGLIALVVATLVASARARAMPGDVVRRRIVAIAAAAYTAIVVAAVWIWGGSMATAGRATQLRAGALVRLAVEGVRVPLTGTVAIGHAAGATVRVPGEGGELARIEAGQDGKVIVRGAVLAGLHGEDPGQAATVRGCAASEASYGLPAGAAVVVIDCAGAAPARALVVRNAGRGELVIAPLAWRGRFVREELTARAGDALRIGGGDEAIPGLTTWDLIAPHGAAAMLAIPADPTDCGVWLPAGAGRAWPATDGCALDTGTFVVQTVALVPDGDLVVDRGARAALAIGGPPLALLLVLAFAARRDRRIAGVGRALRLCVLGATLTALCGWRLVWAYRIDMLRELASAGPRLVDNQLSVVAVGAALAGNAVLAHEWLVTASPARRALASVLGWTAWLAIAALVVNGTSGASGLWPVTASHAGVLGFSLAAALAPVGCELASRRAARIAPELVVAAIAIAAAAGKLAWPRSALVKLGLGYALVLAGHAVLRRVLARDTGIARRCLGVALIAIAALALARYDTGVALAIAGTGLALAMLVAGHDAAYDASQAARIGVLEREHARLLAAHGAAAIAIAIGVAASAIVAGDRALVVRGAGFVVHAPLVVAALFTIAAAIARSHRRGWLPWLCAAVAALAVWSARDALVERATAGDNVGARRVAAVLEPGYALLRDQRAYVANASAWREAALLQAGAQAGAPGGAADRWAGEGYFGARIRDPGVSRSIDNDYLPVLIARETGVAGLTQTIGLLLVIAVGAGAIASLRLGHASRQHRARWLATAMIGGLAVYQPLAALGVLPLTGISWPGLGIDSPADLWLFVLGAVWCLACGDDARDDERVRGTARLVRARAIVLAALAVVAIAAVIVVARAGAATLARVPGEDARIDQALGYAASIACPWPGRDGASLDEVVPAGVLGTPRDDASRRFDRELAAGWARDRSLLVAALGALGSCRGTAGRWGLAAEGAACVATLRAGVPTVRLRVERAGAGFRGACSVSLARDLIAAVRAPAQATRAARIRVVGEAMGASARDVGELVAGTRVVRLRPGTPATELARIPSGTTPASRVAIAGDVVLDLRATPPAVVLHGAAELFVAEAGQPPVWRRMSHGPEVVLDRVTLIAAGPPEHRRVALFRPARAWAGAPPAVDTLLADDTSSIGDRARRVYPQGAGLPELGWVNPFEVDRSLGLDGWIHAALARPATSPARCGTLAPAAIAPGQVCSPSPLDGVLECRVALQPELAARLRGIAEQVLAAPRGHTGRDVTPVRVAYVVLRGDTGELLAQGNVVPGRPPLAYAPSSAAAEAALIQLRESRGESDAERVEWNLPIAVGSTFKPIVARAAEQAFPQVLASLALTAEGHATGCKARRGAPVDPLLGHCPPTSLAEPPGSADLHDYLARSLNWYQAALGVIGLGMPEGRFSVKGEAVTLADIAASDLATWPASSPLEIADSAGAIIDGHRVVLEGLRRTPLWSRVEALLGRPLCTLGDRARCEAAAERADVCAARALPIAGPGRDLRYLVALGPDQLDVYPDDRPAQTHVPIREYFQLLRGSGVHSVGSLAQLTDAFGRVVYDPSSGAPRLAASWFPAPAVGVTPAWSCAKADGHANTVLGADGGLCAVVQGTGTAHDQLGALLADPSLAVYGAKTGTTDSLADIARRTAACRAWNDRHPPAARLVCGKAPPDDSLFVIAFGVVTARGTVPITLGVQLQRGGKGSAAHVTPELVHAIADYLR